MLPQAPPKKTAKKTKKNEKLTRELRDARALDQLRSRARQQGKALSACTARALFAMVRKKIVFQPTLVGRVRSCIQGKLTTPPLWYGAVQRAPPTPSPVRSSVGAVVFELEDRLRRVFLARNPHVRDEPLDLSRGGRKALRSSTVWSAVYEWICAMEDLGMSEEDAYAHVLEQRALATHGQPDDVTELSLKWAQMTDAAIAQTMSDVETSREQLPPHWNAAAGAFQTPMRGIDILVQPRPASSPSAGEADSDSALAPRAGMDELDAETREVVEFADDVVSRKLDEIEAALRALIASEPYGSEQTPGSEQAPDAATLAYLEQDVPAPSDLPTDVFELKVKRVNGQL
jgi:hypothetical protein